MQIPQNEISSKEEIGNAIIALSRLKDPRSMDALREIMNSEDPAFP